MNAPNHRLIADSEPTAKIVPLAPATPTPHVFIAMAAVQAELAEIGIAKSETATGGATFRFRGIDQVMNALAPILSKHSLLIVPNVVSRECEVRQTKSGSAMYFVTVSVVFNLVSGVDGSQFSSGRTIGEANDTGDKATNKAMSIAYKYFCFQTFCIPLEPTDDPDSHVAEPTLAAPKKATAPQKQAVSDFPGDRPASTTPTPDQMRAKRPADQTAALDKAENDAAALKERAAKCRIALSQAASAAGCRTIWETKCNKVRDDLDRAGMKGELARLADYYQQCLSGFGRNIEGISEPENEAAL